MPMYSWECNPCRLLQEHYFSVNDKKEVKCESCGEMMKRVYIYNVVGDITPYKDGTLGYVTSRQDKSNKLKEKGLTYYEDSAFKGDAGTTRRDKYNMQKESEAQAKDIYKFRGTKIYD